MPAGRNAHHVGVDALSASDVVETLEVDGPRIRAVDFAGRIDKLKTRALWNLRARARERMVERLYARGLPAGDSDALWIGCAGRLGAGLRTDLLFDDLARLGRLLDDPLNAVRLVFSGAAAGNCSVRASRPGSCEASRSSASEKKITPSENPPPAR